MAAIYGEYSRSKANVVCTGMVSFGATAADVHHCEIEAYGDETDDRFTLSIYPHDRERDVPVTLRLKPDEARQLHQRLQEMVSPHLES